MSRELDIEVAEKIMGHEWRVINRRRQNFHAPSGLIVIYKEGKELNYTGHGKSNLLEFSSDISAAMEVVEKMRSDGWSFACTLYEGQLPYASFCKRTVASSRNAEADSLPEAICRAALAALKTQDTSTVSGTTKPVSAASSLRPKPGS